MMLAKYQIQREEEEGQWNGRDILKASQLFSLKKYSTPRRACLLIYIFEGKVVGTIVLHESGAECNSIVPKSIHGHNLTGLENVRNGLLLLGMLVFIIEFPA